MEPRKVLMKANFWFFFGIGVVWIVLFWPYADTILAKAVIIWTSGVWPMIGAEITFILSGRSSEGWEEFKKLFWLFVFAPLGPFMWLVSLVMYKEALDYYHTIEWYRVRGIDYLREIKGKD